MPYSIRTWNKTKSKWIKYRIEEAVDARMFLQILAKNGYGCVLSADEEEGEDHGYKDNDR